jgi:hypothetical protein
MVAEVLVVDTQLQELEDREEVDQFLLQAMEILESILLAVVVRVLLQHHHKQHL